MNVRRWQALWGTGLVVIGIGAGIVVSCSNAGGSTPSAPPPVQYKGQTINPNWDTVNDFEGDPVYITHFCYHGREVFMADSNIVYSSATMSIAAGGAC